MQGFLIEVARQTSSIVWAGLAGFALWLFREPVRTRLREVAGVRTLGVELNFVSATLAGAAAEANRGNEIVSASGRHLVLVTKADRERVLSRAKRCLEALRGRRILWIDDRIANNRRERALLGAFELEISSVQSNDAAYAALADDETGYDLIISDIGRPTGEPDGLDFLRWARRSGPEIPVIFYVGRIDLAQPLPPGAFGLTNRPDELLHLVIDALERSA